MKQIPRAGTGVNIHIILSGATPLGDLIHGPIKKALVSLLLCVKAVEDVVDNCAVHCALVFALPSGPEVPHIVLAAADGNGQEQNVELTIAECLCHLLNLTITHVFPLRDTGNPYLRLSWDAPEMTLFIGLVRDWYTLEMEPSHELHAQSGLYIQNV